MPDDKSVDATAQANMVGVGTRFVPGGGLVKYGGTTYVRATLVLSPLAPDTQGVLTTVDITEWPKAIEKCVVASDNANGVDSDAAIKIGFLVGTPVSAFRAMPLAYDSRRTPKAKTWQQVRDDDMKRINQWWCDLLNPNNEVNAWPLLAGASRTSTDRINQIRKPGAGGRSTGTANIGDSGNAEAALVLVLERARSLIERMKMHAPSPAGSARKYTLLRDAESNLGYVPPDQFDPTRVWPTWAPSQSTLMALADAAPPEGRSVLAGNSAGLAALARAHAAIAAAPVGPEASRHRAAIVACATARGDTQACFDAVRALDGANLSCRVDEAVARHDDLAKAQTTPAPCDELAALKNAMMQRFMAIQSQPTLARLFNLNVDILIPVEQLVMGLKSFYEDQRFSPFAYLSAEVPRLKNEAAAWTATKFVISADTIVDAFPCTHAELSEGPGCEHLSQQDGALFVNGATTHYDLTSLDVPRALGSRLSHAAGNGQGDNDRGQRLLTLRTAGMSLISFTQCASAFQQMCRSFAFPDTGSGFYDADDLAVGYRLDVATSPRDNALEWRTLCHRNVRFGAKDGPGILEKDIEDVLGRLIPEPARRRVFDSARIVPPGQVVDDKNGGKKIYPEEIVAQWFGPPLGVDTEGRPVPITEEHRDNGALPLSQTIVLKPDTTALPPLRFGHGYRFGLTVKYVGGHSRPMDDFGAYAVTKGARTVLPAPEHSLRRFLRQERIEMPLVTSPEAVLGNIFDELVDGTRESAYSAIVRSTVGESLKINVDAKHARSQRIVVPPSVSADFADLHGVFPNNVLLTDFRERFCDGRVSPGVWKAPKDGLQRVDYDAATGGFPKTTRSKTQPGGDAVFRLRPAGFEKSPRCDAYYPDPAARFLVIALRDRADRLLPGQPKIVEFVLSPGYPDVRPILIETVADPNAIGMPLNQNRIVVRKGASDFKPSATGSGVPVSWVEVRLAPGEDVYCDVWCTPTESQLLNCFDIIETTAAVLALDPKIPNDQCPSCDEVILHHGDTLGFDLKRLRAVQNWSMTSNLTACGVDTKAVPQGVIRCVAARAMDLLQTVGVPEISARARIAMVHAVQRPISRPTSDICLYRIAITPTADPFHDLVIPEEEPRGDPPADSTSILVTGTVTVDAASSGIVTVEATGPMLAHATFDDADNRRRTPDEVFRGLWPRNPFTGASKVPADVYGFEVRRDGSVRLPAESVTLLRLDDCLPDAEYASGAWSRSLLDIQRSAQAARKTGRGFQEATDEAVDEFNASIKTWGTLPDRNGDGTINRAKADHVPSPPRPIVWPETSTLRSPRVSYPFQIKDTMARVVDVVARSASRTAVHFRDKRGDVFGDRDDAVSDARTWQASAKQRVAIPATKAPARVAPLTILPAFHVECGKDSPRAGIAASYNATRKVRVRVRMRRPWFSSGAGERLGIVLWPPEIAGSASRPSRVAGTFNTVARDYKTALLPFLEMPGIDMKGFADVDLGPGGAFITRWGADPIKSNEANIGWVMPPDAFEDLAGAHVFGKSASFEGPPWDMLAEFADDVEHVYVPDAMMPIAKQDNERTDPNEPNFMNVALLTYKPRFDVDTETWFADVAIDTGGMHEPFVRLGLVRFQANAPRMLQVSEPVVEWVQVLPRRTAEVRIDTSAPKCLHVTVRGRGHYGAGANDTIDPSRLDHWLQRPLMRVSVLRRGPNGRETTAMLGHTSAACWDRAEATWIPPTLGAWKDWLKVKAPTDDGSDTPVRPDCALHPKTQGGELVWCTSFDLSEEPLAAKDANAAYAVFIEEVEAMRPATLPNEPVDPTSTDEDWLEVSGPRFAARIDL